MIGLWLGFVVFVIGALILDLGIFNRRVHYPTFRESLIWTGVWVGAAFVFSGVLYLLYQHQGGNGSEAWLSFVTAYVIEESLSVDNLFVISVILAYFKIPLDYRHRILFWGIVGAMVSRGILILGGIVVVERFEWILAGFGGCLLWSAYQLSRKVEPDPWSNPVIRLLRKGIPVIIGLENRLLVRDGWGWALTSSGVALVMVEAADVMFAVDSIPAAFAVTRDPFVIFTSNILAVLGLRSLFFVLDNLLQTLPGLRGSLVVVLGLLGGKMILGVFGIGEEVPVGYTLGTVVVVLGLGVCWSFWR